MGERRQSGVLRHHGMETASASLILAATADGNLLPPFLVIKSNADRENEESDDVHEDLGEDRKKTEEVITSGDEDKTLLKYGMTSGLVVEGDGAVVGEGVMAT